LQRQTLYVQTTCQTCKFNTYKTCPVEKLTMNLKSLMDRYMKATRPDTLVTAKNDFLCRVTFPLKEPGFYL